LQAATLVSAATRSINRELLVLAQEGRNAVFIKELSRSKITTEKILGTTITNRNLVHKYLKV
jgi:hypothetical protein